MKVGAQVARMRTMVRRVYAAALAIFVLGLFVSAPARRADSAMDRSAAALGASLLQYANYLYLSQLFGKSTAIPLYDKFCGNALTAEQIEELRNQINEFRQRDYWHLKCAPVMPSYIQKTRDGTFDAGLRYVRIGEGREWIEKLKRQIRSPEIDIEVLIPRDRQLQLSRLLLPGENPPNIFARYENAVSVEAMFKRIKTISKNVEEIDRSQFIGELFFAAK